MADIHCQSMILFYGSCDIYSNGWLLSAVTELLWCRRLGVPVSPDCHIITPLQEVHILMPMQPQLQAAVVAVCTFQWLHRRWGIHCILADGVCQGGVWSSNPHSWVCQGTSRCGISWHSHLRSQWNHISMALVCFGCTFPLMMQLAIKLSVWRGVGDCLCPSSSRMMHMYTASHAMI